MKTSKYKEAYCTEPSTSVRLPGRDQHIIWGPQKRTREGPKTVWAEFSALS